MLARFTVIQKIAAGYLVFALFSIVALVYALNSMHSQARRTEQLVTRDIRSRDLARDLQTNLMAQERLERQSLLLKDPALVDLFDLRQKEFTATWQTFADLAQPDLQAKILKYEASGKHELHLFKSGQWEEARRHTADAQVPLRSVLSDDLNSYMDEQGKIIDKVLQELPAASQKAFRVTLLLTFIGLTLSLPVALVVTFGIYRSLHELTQATKEIAAGSFSYRLAINSGDEFGDLAREFSQMGRKLRELEILNLDANPLTHLPGNLAIDRELEERIKQGQPFAHMYLDLDNFKAFGDRYGYQAGSMVLARLAEWIRLAVNRRGGSDDLIGHVGGDDYIVLTSPEMAENIARELIEEFDRSVPDFYSPEDRQAGFFVGEDRYGVERKFPLLSLSIAIIFSDNVEFSSRHAFSRECAKMKEHLKTLPGSNYLINRRKKI